MPADTLRQHSLMEPLRPKTKSFQFGMNQMREWRAVTFNRKKRQIVDIREHGAEMPISPDNRQFIFHGHRLR